MKYWLAPWEVDELGAWAPPPGVVGLIDLRTLPGHAGATHGFFATPDDATLSGDLLGEGHIASLAPDNRAAQAWRNATGVAPRGAHLLDWLEYTLTEAADPTGDTGVKPLVPTTRGNLDIHLGGHSLVRRRQFDLTAAHAAPVLDMLRREYAEHRERARAGQVRGPNGIDPEHHRRVLDVWARKYRVDNPEDVFIPRGLPREGRLPHQTSYTESFDQDDSSTVGPDLTWNELVGAWATNTNELECVEATARDKHIRAEHDMSGSDNEAEITWESVSTGSGTHHSCGACCRYSSSATTCYVAWLYNTGTDVYISKIVAGTRTNLSNVSWTPSLPDTIKAEADGTTIKSYLNSSEQDSVTDSAISAGTRGGVFATSSLPSGAAWRADDFSMADLAGAGGGTDGYPIIHRYYNHHLSGRAA